MNTEALSKIVAQTNMMIGIRDEILRAHEAGLGDDEIKAALYRVIKVINGKQTSQS